VAERAGRSLKKVVMELGGSDPLIVLSDADLGVAVEGALFGRMFNTGQSCVSSKRIIVVGHQRGAEFLQLFRESLADQKPGDPADPGTVLGPLSSERALNLLLDQIQVARDGGAKVVLGGSQIDRPGYYLEPTILTGITRDNPAADLEFFGPVASFYTVETEDEAVALANATPFGLGASVFTRDTDRGREVARRIDSGMVFINSRPGPLPRSRSAASRTPGSAASCPTSASASSSTASWSTSPQPAHRPGAPCQPSFPSRAPLAGPVPASGGPRDLGANAMPITAIAGPR